MLTLHDLQSLRHLSSLYYYYDWLLQVTQLTPVQEVWSLNPLLASQIWCSLANSYVMLQHLH